LDTVDFATKRQLLKLLIKRIEVDLDEIRIVYRVQPRPFAHRPASDSRERGVLQDCLKSASSAQTSEFFRQLWFDCVRYARSGDWRSWSSRRWRASS
jgi:hypothetical protein